MPWSSRVGPGSTLCEIRAGTTAQAWLMRVAGTAAVDSAMLARLFFFDRHVPFEQILPVSGICILKILGPRRIWDPFAHRSITVANWIMAAPAHHPVVGKFLLQLLEDIDKPVAYFDFHYRLESLWQEAGSLRRGFVNNSAAYSHVLAYWLWATATKATPSSGATLQAALEEAPMQSFHGK